MIGINCYKREPQNKKEPVEGEGNECDAEIERESFHIGEIDRSLS